MPEPREEFIILVTWERLWKRDLNSLVGMGSKLQGWRPIGRKIPECLGVCICNMGSNRNNYFFFKNKQILVG